MAKIKNVKQFYSKLVIEAYRDLREASEPRGISRYDARQIIDARVERELAKASAMITALNTRVKNGLVKESTLKRSVSAGDYNLYSDYKEDPSRLRADLQNFAKVMNAKCPDSIVGWEVCNVLHPNRISWIDLGSDAGIGKLVYQIAQEGNSKGIDGMIQSLTDDEMAFIEFDLESFNDEQKKLFANAIEDRMYISSKKLRILQDSKDVERIDRINETISACEKWKRALAGDNQIESEN